MEPDDTRDSLTATQRYWFDHLEAAENAGTSLREYADRRGLAVQSLYTWKQALKRKGVWPRPPLGISLRRAEVLETTPESAGIDMPLSGIGCRVHLPNGAVVELGSAGALPLAEVFAAVGAL